MKQHQLLAVTVQILYQHYSMLVEFDIDLFFVVASMMAKVEPKYKRDKYIEIPLRRTITFVVHLRRPDRSHQCTK
jgi:hypothetical protein